ncbi:hypothetical protein C5615_22475 [Burkholderia cepacia]|uniref:Uncharacterized protein n=1 Tax=Burkholderia cepacia TaxID=292 RepID=A0A2S8ILQ6_BURCE|nr:hypothetical protein C5615_22475 [Burkholderia cepacia]
MPLDDDALQPLARRTESSGLIHQRVTKAIDIDNPAAVADISTSRDRLVTQPKLRDRRAQP